MKLKELAMLLQVPKDQRDELKAYNKKLLNLKEDLVAELDHINSAEYIEQQARKDLKMIKENELLFVVEEGN